MPLIRFIEGQRNFGRLKEIFEFFERIISGMTRVMHLYCNKEQVGKNGGNQLSWNTQVKPTMKN